MSKPAKFKGAGLKELYALLESVKSYNGGDLYAKYQQNFLEIDAIYSSVSPTIQNDLDCQNEIAKIVAFINILKPEIEQSEWKKMTNALYQKTGRRRKKSVGLVEEKGAENGQLNTENDERSEDGESNIDKLLDEIGYRALKNYSKKYRFEILVFIISMVRSRQSIISNTLAFLDGRIYNKGKEESDQEFWRQQLEDINRLVDEMLEEKETFDFNVVFNDDEFIETILEKNIALCDKKYLRNQDACSLSEVKKKSGIAIPLEKGGWSNIEQEEEDYDEDNMDELSEDRFIYRSRDYDQESDDPGSWENLEPPSGRGLWNDRDDF